MKTTNERITNGFYPTGDPKSLYYRESRHPMKPVTPERIGYPRRLLSTSAKTDKGGKLGVSTKVMYLTPGAFCPAASPGCRASCLGFSSGRLSYQRASLARDRRSALLMHHPQHFIAMLDMEIDEHKALSLAAGLTPAVRLNGSSDVLWERSHGELFARHPEVQFYDYTKIPRRAMDFAERDADASSWPANYHLTFSLSERNGRYVGWMLENGVNVAVVFQDEIPAKVGDYPTVDGDDSDARWLDPTPCVVGLSAKGTAKTDQTGFVVQPKWLKRS